MTAPQERAPVSRHLSRSWETWSADPQQCTAPRPQRTEIIEARLNHGRKEYLRAGHANWDNPEDPRYVVKWRVYYP